MGFSDRPEGIFDERRFADAASGTVEVGFVKDSDGHRPREVWGFAVPGDLDPDETGREILLAVDPASLGVSFVMETRRSYYSWGVEGASWTVVLNVAESAITTAPAQMIGDLMLDLVQQRGQPNTTRRPLPLQDASERACWLVSRRYGGPEQEYQVLADQRREAEGGWSIELGAPDGTRYDVDLGLAAGFPYSHRIRRRE
jgi:hypothetical protein